MQFLEKEKMWFCFVMGVFIIYKMNDRLGGRGWDSVM